MSKQNQAVKIIFKKRQPYRFTAAIGRIKELTDKSFAVDINLFHSMRHIDNNYYADILVNIGL